MKYDAKGLMPCFSKHLRRIYRYSPMKKWAREYWKGVGCLDCGDKGVGIEWDHNPPVVDVKKSAAEMTPIEYLSRLFCLSPDGLTVDISKLQPRCSACHLAVTKAQRSERAVNKRARGFKPVYKKKRRMAKKKRAKR